MRVFRHSSNGGHTTLKITEVDRGFYMEIVDSAGIPRQATVMFLPNVEATELSGWLNPLPVHET